MSKNQIRLIIFSIGVFLLSLTVYRWQVFTHFSWSILLLKALIPISLLLIFAGLARMLKIPLILCLLIPTLIEATCWQYVRHVTRANTHVAHPNVGVMEKWVNYRDVIQYNGQFSSFSPDLSYTLRPRSEGYHEDLEYRNKFTVNSMGVRDDEASLHDPRIIFIGDSFTMGWGVDQDQTFAQLVEKKAGVGALNAGISSYGTFREMLLLEKMPRDSCRLVVIQYCDNDLEENTARNTKNKEEQQLTLERFEKVTVFNELNEGYFPMRFTYFFVREKDLFVKLFTSPVQIGTDLYKAVASWVSGKPLPDPGPPSIKSAEQAREHTVQFFKVLEKIRTFYSGNIIVAHIDGRYTKPELTRAFEAEAALRDDPKLHFLQTPGFLLPDDYYPIDGHLNAQGHRKLADHIYELIRKEKLLP